MEPPRRPSLSRQTQGTHPFKIPHPTKVVTDFSPTPFSSTSNINVREENLDDGYTTTGKTARLGWDETSDSSSPHATRLQIELAECVETRTVTTTTTTKRTYPPLLVRPPRSLQNLDAKEYPLASRPTPHELTEFSYEVDGEVVRFREDDTSLNPSQKFEANSSSKPRFHGRLNSTGYETPNTSSSTRRLRRVEDVTEDSFSRRPSNPPRSPDSLGRLSSILKRRPTSQKRRELGFSYAQEMALEGFDRHGLSKSTTASTPDVSSLDLRAKADKSVSFMTSTSDDSLEPFESPSSPSLTAAHGAFPSAVATPPIADTDLEPFEMLQDSPRQSSIPPSLSTQPDIQNASLPSPSLSPTLAAANMHNALYPAPEEDDSETAGSAQSGDSQESRSGSMNLQRPRAMLDPKPRRSQSLTDRNEWPTVMDTHSMLDTFDSMPSEMKTFMMYQFLRRCPRKTLHTIANIVNPSLKCDFLEELPPDLSLHIFGFLDHRDLCHAAQVSKRWRNIIDSNETGWKELFDRDGFVLAEGELERAITEGWGWQDPCGADGWERDISYAPTSSDNESVSIASTSKSIASDLLSIMPRLASKRKRVSASASSGSERGKRRALNKENLKRISGLSKGPKSEGPNAAATAAALSVPNPKLGLPTLCKLHLFKSIYRRHYMLQRNWMSGKVQPHHMAFPAHPRHVITCLQFDDDKILTGSDDTYIHVYDTKTGALRKRLQGHEGGVWALQYQDNILVSGSTDRSVRVWDIEKGKCTHVFHGHTSTVRCLQILAPVNTGQTIKGKPVMVPEKPLIITGSRDSQLRVWKLPESGSKSHIQTGPPANESDCPYFIRVLQGHTHSVRAIAAHEDTLVSGSYDTTVRVWKISTGETLHQFRGHAQKVYSVVLDHERRRCISGSMDNTVKIWSLDTGACLYTLEGHSSLVGLLDLQDGRLVSAAADSTLRIWDPENGQCKSTLTAHTGAITCFQHDGTKVISGSDRTLKMWDVKRGECLQDLLTDLSGVWQVKFDERRCVAAVQRDSLTFIEVLDFGASRDGVPAQERGKRILLAPSDMDRITDDEEFAP